MHKYNSIKKSKQQIKINNLPVGSKAFAVWLNAMERYKYKFTYGQKIIYAVLKIFNIIKWGDKKHHHKFFASQQTIFKWLNGESNERTILSNKDWLVYFNYSRWGSNELELSQDEINKIKNKLLLSKKTADRAFKFLKENKLIEKVDNNPLSKSFDENYKLAKPKKLIWNLIKEDINFKTDMKPNFRGWFKFAVNFGNSFKTNEDSLEDSPPSHNKHLANLSDKQWNKHVKENWESWKDFFKKDKED